MSCIRSSRMLFRHIPLYSMSSGLLVFIDGQQENYNKKFDKFNVQCTSSELFFFLTITFFSKQYRIHSKSNVSRPSVVVLGEVTNVNLIG